MSSDVDAWLASKGLGRLAATAAPVAAATALPQTTLPRRPSAPSVQRRHPSANILTRALAMPHPTTAVVALQPVIVSPIDVHAHGSWAALTHPAMRIEAVAVACADGGTITSGLWLPTSSRYRPPTEFGPLTRWTSTTCPEPVANLLAAGAPVIAAPLVVAQHALASLEWPQPSRCLDALVQLCTANLDGDWDEIAAWLTGATDLGAISVWSSLRGFTGIILPTQPLAETMSQALAMTRVALGVATRCGTTLGTAAEDAAWAVDQCINTRGLPIDRALIERVTALPAAPHLLNKFAEVDAHACPDDRVRGVYGFVGQHTGRWTARRPALHNLRKTLLTADKLQPQIELVRSGGRPTWGNLADMLGNLERPMFCAPPGMVFVVGDQKQAEPRGVFYFAGLTKVLDVMDRIDLYLERSLQRLFFGDAVAVDHPDAGRRRKVLKIVIIACGYGMGADMLRKYALESWNFDFVKAGVDPERAVEVYRGAFHQVTGLWYSLGKQSLEAIRSTKPVVTDIGTFSFEDGDLLSTLKSGRVIRYPRATVVQGKYGPVMEYWKGGPLRGERETAWGGILFQHAVTGTLRDVHAGHLVALEAAGLDPIAHTHDEAVGLVQTSQGNVAVTAMAAIMSQSPDYLPGLRLRCEPYLTERLGIEGLRR